MDAEVEIRCMFNLRGEVGGEGIVTQPDYSCNAVIQVLPDVFSVN
jgi:hypothetical protein